MFVTLGIIKCMYVILFHARSPTYLGAFINELIHNPIYLSQLLKILLEIICSQYIIKIDKMVEEKKKAADHKSKDNSKEKS